MEIDLGTTLQKMNILSNTDNTSVVSINLLVALICACIVIGHLLEGNRWMNESITPLIIGVCTGVVILLISGGKKSRLLIFSEDLFFIYLLPPIIFNAGKDIQKKAKESDNSVQASLTNYAYLLTMLLACLLNLTNRRECFNFLRGLCSTTAVKVKKKQFFRNFSTITLFGTLGTLISFAVISLGAVGLLRPLDIDLKIGDYLALGAIFAATDSVCTLQVLNQDETPLLYSLVFGEGVVNDATSVVLFNAVQNFDLTNINTTIALELVGNFLYLYVTSTILGVAAGLLSAYVIKKLYFGRHSTDREVSIMMLLPYLSYMLSELFNLSAILTVFFCGIVMSHYTWHNVTENSRITTKHTFATLSFVAEIFIFLYVGMDALDIEKWRFVRSSPKTSISVSGILLGLVLVGRAAFVFPLSFLSNLTKKSPDEKIDFKKQITIWWAGLMRGAVSMALAYKQFRSLGHTNVRDNAIMITSTITVVLFSTVVFGLITKPLVRFLTPSSKPLARMSSSVPVIPHSITVPLLGDEQDSLTDLYGQNIINGQASEASGVGQNFPRPNSLRMLLTRPTHTVHYYWRKFDNAFMRPVFGGRGFVPFVPGSPTEGSLHQFPEELENAVRTLN